jgi:hypothetical protein
MYLIDILQICSTAIVQLHIHIQVDIHHVYGSDVSAECGIVPFNNLPYYHGRVSVSQFVNDGLLIAL